jgi:hypothetical protein
MDIKRIIGGELWLEREFRKHTKQNMQWKNQEQIVGVAQARGGLVQEILMPNNNAPLREYCTPLYKPLNIFFV